MLSDAVARLSHEIVVAQASVPARKMGFLVLQHAQIVGEECNNDDGAREDQHISDGEKSVYLEDEDSRGSTKKLLPAMKWLMYSWQMTISHGSMKRSSLCS